MRSRNIEIQSLRGYAILITIFAHLAPLLPHMEPYLVYFWLGGGVDLFFCISGFVIARVLFERERSSFLEFYLPFLIKRVFRLWPAAIFWSLIVLLLSLFFNARGSFDTFENNLFMAVVAWFQVVNFQMIFSLYFDLSQVVVSSPLRIYWSLSLEEQFYLVFPVLLFFLGNRKIAVLALFLAMAQLFLYRPWPSPLWFFRTDAICMGILIAWLHFKGYALYVTPAFLNSTVLRRVSSLSLCVLLFAVARKEIIWFYNGLVVLVAAGLVFFASFDKGYFVRDGLFRKIMSYIGERSYSMYLTHMVCIVFVREFYVRFYGSLPREGFYPICLGFVVFFLVFLTSEISYRVIETPLRNKGRNFTMTKSRDGYLGSSKKGASV